MGVKTNMAVGRGRVGVELELGGLSLDEVTVTTVTALSGRARTVSAFERIVDTEWGEFVIELDSQPVKRLGKILDDKAGTFARTSTAAVESLAGVLVPSEIVSPPLSRRDLPIMDRLADALGAAGGRGTFDGLRLAFGVHFNPELEDLGPSAILAHLQAFVVLYDTIVARSDIDLSRRLTPFVDPFPNEYAVLILGDTYLPRMSELIDDYLLFNPTRNRALDMLPMFAHIDRERVRRAVDDHLVKPRPTFHYRLPNSRVGEPGWTISHEWVSWLAVEMLAANAELLIEARRDALHERQRGWVASLQRALAW